MNLSEVPLMQPVLCKHANTSWSEVFEIMNLGRSENGRAVYVRMTFGMPGQGTHNQHYWRDVEDMDKKWEVFDTLSEIDTSGLDDETKKACGLIVAGAEIAGEESAVNAARFLGGDIAAAYVAQQLSYNA